jgi:hypothetical protein
MGENLCQLYILQGINNQNIQEARKTINSQRINDPMKKWANELNRKLSKEVQMAKKPTKKPHMKKCVPGHKGNANQNHVRIPSHSC